MRTNTPLVCNLSVFTPAEREAHSRVAAQLMQAVQRVQEVENGYALTFPGEAEFISRIAEFISKERLCCPFLKFSLNMPSSYEPISLVLTGPVGTQEFLRSEFDGVFQ